MISVPVDVMKVLVKALDKGKIKVNDTHEKVVSNTIYNLAIMDVLDILEGIANGTIDQQQISTIMNKE